MYSTEFFDFQTCHSGHDTTLSGIQIERTDTLMWSSAIKYGYSMSAQFLSQANDRLCRKIRRINCSVKRVGLIHHTRFSRLQLTCVDHVESGGFRAMFVRGEKRIRPRRAP